tara:strand:+ start:32801 stop:33019 length:219 start_codon:yes stop_codon:yes gene_type:complete
MLKGMKKIFTIIIFGLMTVLGICCSLHIWGEVKQGQVILSYDTIIGIFVLPTATLLLFTLWIVSVMWEGNDE